MSSAPVIRAAGVADLDEVRAIYGREVLEGTASFELDPPDLDEIRRRFDAIRETGLPYVVAEVDGRVAGYAYAGPYRARPAYRYCVEDSVYIAPFARRRGIGLALLDAVIAEATAAGRRQMVAVVGDSAHVASIALHERAGFRPVGVLRNIGFKFDRWLDTVLLQRALGPGADVPPQD